MKTGLRIPILDFVSFSTGNTCRGLSKNIDRPFRKLAITCQSVAIAKADLKEKQKPITRKASCRRKNAIHSMKMPRSIAIFFAIYMRRRSIDGSRNKASDVRTAITKY